MANLLIITQKVDEDDDLLGFFVDWIKGFSSKFDKVFVITLAKGKYDLPANVSVYSLGKERNNPKIIRLFNFYKFLFRLAPQVSGMFAHMSPIFAIASWPAAFIFHKKIILWYLHRSVTRRLKLAEKLSYKIVTAARESLKLDSNKIIEAGHGINVDKFRTDRNWSSKKSDFPGRSNFKTDLKILSVGRISKIKNYDILVQTAKLLRDKGFDFNIKIVGQPVMANDFPYLNLLKSMRRDLKLEKEIEFVGFIPYSQITPFYKEADFVIGLTPEGGIDKTILEGMASGCLVLTSNTANMKYFGENGDKLIFEYQNPNSLADKIIYLHNLPSEQKKILSDFLVYSVSKHHCLENTIGRIVNLL